MFDLVLGALGLVEDLDGLDGFRCDAVPYLLEREGTICENLPETHDYLKEIRRRIDETYKGRILLAEANQWPSDVRPYFGDADEFHRAFHFPLMPRLYMGVRSETRDPIIDMFTHTPEIPANCQWCLFLRNHDELTLEMCSGEERDYMYYTYARDPKMRRNIGIARRLAPLLDNDRRKIELLNSLVFTLPGSPIIYYADFVLTGHVHQPPFKPAGAWADRIGNTWVFNPGNQVGPVPTHIEIDLAAGSAVWRSLMGEERISLAARETPRRTLF